MTHLAIKNTYFHFASVLFCALLLNACGELAYKRGASANDLDASKKACLAKNMQPDAVKKCMEDQGWVVQSLGGDDALEAQEAIQPNASAEQKQTDKTTTAAVKNTDSDKLKVSEKPFPPIKTKVKDPMDVLKISSWWKLGSGADNLKTATDECVKNLGLAHQPDNKTHQVTRGFLLCMSEKGWSGLQEK